MWAWQLPYYIDYAFFNVAAWVFLGLIVLGIPQNELATYSFSLLFIAFAAIMTSWPVMLLFYFGSVTAACSQIYRHLRWAWCKFSNLVSTAFDFALGKFIIGLLVVHTVVAAYFWIKFHFSLPELIAAAVVRPHSSRR